MDKVADVPPAMALSGLVAVLVAVVLVVFDAHETGVNATSPASEEYE